MPTAPAKQRNYAVDFWRIYCTIGVAFMHFHWDGMSDGFLAEVLGDTYPPFCSGGEVLAYFLLIGGYLMVASYKSKQRKGLTNIPASTQAWRYTAGRFQGMFPAVFLSTVLGWAVVCGTNNFNPRQWIQSLMVNIWDFTGLDGIGAMGMPSSLGGNTQRMMGADPGRVMSLNYPLWYISGIFITAVFLYYLIAKNEDNFKCIWAPFFSIVYLANFGFAEIDWYGYREGTVLGMPINMVWVGGGLCMGALLWYFVDFLKRKTYGKKAKIGLTVLNAVCSVYLIYVAFSNYYEYNMVDANGNWYNNEQILVPAMCILIICNTLDHDYLTTLLNRPIFGKIGAFSLYWFVCHYPMYRFSGWLGTEMGFTSYWQYFGVFVGCTTVLGFILMKICKKWFEPLLGRFFSDPPKKEEAPVPAATAQN